MYLECYRKIELQSVQTERAQIRQLTQSPTKTFRFKILGILNSSVNYIYPSVVQINCVIYKHGYNNNTDIQTSLQQHFSPSWLALLQLLLVEAGSLRGRWTIAFWSFWFNISYFFFQSTFGFFWMYLKISNHKIAPNTIWRSGNSISIKGSCQSRMHRGDFHKGGGRRIEVKAVWSRTYTEWHTSRTPSLQVRIIAKHNIFLLLETIEGAEFYPFWFSTWKLGGGGGGRYKYNK